MRQVPMLLYHWFSPSEGTSGSLSPQLEITKRFFAEQMKELKERGYEFISMAQALDPTAQGELPKRPIVITFDDGTLDFWEHARPALEANGLTTTLFVVTGYVGGESSWDEALGEPARPLMSWDQLATLKDAGHEIESHTHNHRVLTGLQDDQVLEEYELSRSTIQEKLGHTPKFLAYPRGFYEDRHKVLAEQAGYAGACSVILHWRDLWRSDRYELKRMSIKGTESMSRFGLRLRLSQVVRMSNPPG